MEKLNAAADWMNLESVDAGAKALYSLPVGPPTAIG